MTRLVLYPLAITCALCICNESVRADTVVLRSGAQYQNVKAKPVGQAHRIEFEDGRTQTIPNSMIRSVRPSATSWPAPQPQPPVHEAWKGNIPAPPAPPLSPVPPEASPGSSLDPIIKSAILPGWGQYSQGRKRAGLAFSAASLLLFQQYWSLRQKHALAEQDYNDPVPVGLVAAQSVSGALTVVQAAAINIVYLSRKEKSVYELQRKGNTMLALLPVVWGWNMLDILSGGFPWKGPTGTSRGLTPVFFVSAGPGSIAVTLRYSL